MTLHLLHLPVNLPRLMEHGREHGLVAGNRAVELGYLVHALLARLCGPGVAEPFDIQPNPDDASGRRLSVLAYAGQAAGAIEDRARREGDAAAMDAIAWDRAASKPMPAFEVGQRLGFRVRVCPVVRIGKHHPLFAHGAEIDPYLALVKRGGGDETVPTREAVYREWLSARLAPAAALDGARLTSLRDARLWRKGVPGDGPRSRMHGHDRPVFGRRAMIGRREAVFEGALHVTAAEPFQALLARGVGRHRAFGFGMLLLRPAPGG